MRVDPSGTGRCVPRAVYTEICVNRFYPKTQLSWLARLDHSHCNSADPLSDWLEVCCVFYRPGPGGATCVVWWWKVLESRGRGGNAPQGSRRPRGGCHRELGHMHCGSAGPWQASASCRLRKGCPGAMSSTRTIQSWRGAPMGSCCARGRRGPSVVPTRPVQIHSTVRELEYRLRAMPAGLGPSVRFHPTTRLPDARQSSSLPA